MQKTAASPKVIYMTREHLAAVLAIETASFEFPWSEADFLRCLRQRNCLGKVAVQGRGLVLGFIVYELHKNRIHVLDLAVDPLYRREGVGRTLIDNARACLAPGRRTRAMLEVRETNLRAQLFFKALGFRAISLLRDFYEDTDEDAYLMQYRVAGPRAARQVADDLSRET